MHLSLEHSDLITPDGKIVSLEKERQNAFMSTVVIKEISPCFLGFFLPKTDVFFNLRSVLAQLGVQSETRDMHLSATLRRAEIKLELLALNETGTMLLKYLKLGAFIGKLFAADKSRRVRTAHYISRMFGRTDKKGRPLLSLGEKHDRSDLRLETWKDRAIAHLLLKPGIFSYDHAIRKVIPIIAKALTQTHLKMREFLRLMQIHDQKAERKIPHGQLLLVKTIPLHIYAVFARVVDELLPKGFRHTAASILQPDTCASGDMYEFYGTSNQSIHSIPLEFYTLSPYREHIFFGDREQFQDSLKKPEILFNAMETAPEPIHDKCATFVVKVNQLLNLKSSDWIKTARNLEPLAPSSQLDQHIGLVAHYLRTQPSYPFLAAIEKGSITSQGILLCRYFPSPMMKPMLLSEHVQRCLKGIYFYYPSRSHGDFFSHEDRSMLIDLAKSGLPVFWLDQKMRQTLQYTLCPKRDVGMFVPPSKVKQFVNATMIGVYGSTLVEDSHKMLLEHLIKGLLKYRQEMDHPLLHARKPLALVTDGGLSVMSMVNRIAKELGLLSCAHVFDFRFNRDKWNAQQEHHLHVEAKMTCRFDQLAQYQAEFHLDLPIFLMGGVELDFLLSLEEMRRTMMLPPMTPVLLIGDPSYWKEKMSHRFLVNLKEKTIKGTEWISNSFFCVQTAHHALKVYKDFFEGKLRIGPEGGMHQNGFVVT